MATLHMPMDSTKTFDLGGRRIGTGEPAFLIAEVGLAHDGSLGSAHAYIDAAAECRVDAVKFQTHIAEAESTAQEQFRVRVFPQDATRYDYWKRTSFTRTQWIELAEHARAKGLLFLSSPFSDLAVEWLLDCGVPAWKVASGELTNFPLLEKMCRSGKPLLLSSGMSSWEEIGQAVTLVNQHGGTFGIFQCTTSYPCPPENWGLNVLGEIRERFHCPVGLSDHSGSIVPNIAAIALGANMLEFHVAFSKSQFGPDAKASLTFDQVGQLVEDVRALELALRNPIDKNAQAEKLSHLHQLFTKSIVAARALTSGTILQPNDLAFKKPGTGLPASQAQRLLGRKLLRDVPVDHFFSDCDFEAVESKEQETNSIRDLEHIQ